MEEKNELNDIILNKGGSSSGSKKTAAGNCDIDPYSYHCIGHYELTQK